MTLEDGDWKCQNMCVKSVTGDIMVSQQIGIVSIMGKCQIILGMIEHLWRD